MTRVFLQNFIRSIKWTISSKNDEILFKSIKWTSPSMMDEIPEILIDSSS